MLILIKGIELSNTSQLILRMKTKSRHPVAVGIAADAAAPDLAGGDVLEEQDVLPLEAFLHQ